MTIMGGNASWYRNCGGNLDRTQKFHKEQPQNLVVLPSRNTPQEIGTEMLRATPGESPSINSTWMSTERWMSEGAAKYTKSYRGGAVWITLGAVPQTKLSSLQNVCNLESTLRKLLTSARPESEWCIAFQELQEEKKNQLCNKNVLEIFCKILILHFILATIDRQIFI